MSAPVLVSITPGASALDVVLGSDIIIVFDQPIDAKSINESTFSVTGPPITAQVSPEQLVRFGNLSNGVRESIAGIYSFPSPTTVVFNPTLPFRPTTKYTVLLVGATSVLVKDSIKNLVGEVLPKSVQVSFSTGVLSLETPPQQSPVAWADPQVQPWMKPKLDPNSIKISPKRFEGNDLSQVIVLTFPADLDPTSFALADIGVVIDPIVDDPLLTPPPDLQYTVAIAGNKMTITITGWGA